MSLNKFIKTYIKTRKAKLKKLNKENDNLFSDLKAVDKHNDELKGIISGAQIALNQAYVNTRELFLGAGEFVLGRGVPAFKAVKVLIGDEDVTNKVSKIVISGVDFLEID